MEIITKRYSCTEHAILVGIVGLAPGTFHTMLWKEDGSVWSTGIKMDAVHLAFVPVISSGATAAAAGTGYSIVIKHDGGVWTTVKKSRGQLSFFDGSLTSKRTFYAVKTIGGAKAVAAGSYHSLVLGKRGRVWAMGWNKYAQLGDGSTLDKAKFIRLISLGEKFTAIAIAAGEIHSIVLKRDGSVWAAGRNYNGQLGDGTKDDRKTFVMAVSRGVVDVTAGSYHSMVLKQDSGVWTTGSNEYGQLGDGSTVDRVSYVQVVLHGAKAVVAGSRHSMVLKQDGSVWTTGYNQYGQLGTGLHVNSRVFVRVIFDGVKTIAAGAFHSMVLKQDGSVWATGSNKEGQLGDGSTVSQKIFIRLSPFSYG